MSKRSAWRRCGQHCRDAVALARQLRSVEAELAAVQRDFVNVAKLNHEQHASSWEECGWSTCRQARAIQPHDIGVTETSRQ